MKKLIVFISLILLMSCSKRNSNSIDLFNNVSFGMQTGEVSMFIQSDVNALYSEYFNHKQPQIPLFKYIKNIDYDIFIGIPYDTSLKKMVKTQLVKTDSSNVFFESNSNYFFKRYRKDGFYISEYATVFKNNTIIYVASMTKKKVVSDSLFNKLEIAKRIKLLSN